MQRVLGNIRAEMARNKVTQEMLAERLRLSQVGISKRLSGITPLRLDEFVVIAEALGVAPVVLLGVDEEVSA